VAVQTITVPCILGKDALFLCSLILKDALSRPYARLELLSENFDVNLGA
jgi:hypothetical protein